MSDIHVLNEFFFFFNDTATTEIYTLSLHDALPIWGMITYFVLFTVLRFFLKRQTGVIGIADLLVVVLIADAIQDRKSTRLNSSHANISYAVFCLKKNKHPNFSHSNISYPHFSFNTN